MHLNLVAIPVNLADILSVDNYKFFQHRECEYFPCHKTDNADGFSCLMCFCPLYHKTDCGGNYTVLDNEVKDCTNCLVPHCNYDYVIKKIYELK